MIEYGKDGWPTKRCVELVSRTPEEKKLLSVLDYLQAHPDASEQQRLVEEVLAVVEDYAHMKARIEELEDKLDEREARISDLEDEVEQFRASDSCDND